MNAEKSSRYATEADATRLVRVAPRARAHAPGLILSTAAIAVAGAALWVATRGDPPSASQCVTASTGPSEVAVAPASEPEAFSTAPVAEPTPMTGASLPDDAGTTPPPATVRFMASDPHVPLAEVFRGELRSPEHAACTAWPGRGHRWLALDRWGGIAGTHESVGAEAYDVTGCYEMSTRRLSGGDGVGLLASIGYTPGPSFHWTPTQEQRAAFDALLARVDAIFEPEAGAGVREPLFFRGFADADGHPTPTAVIGGRVLMVAALVDDAWTVRHLETQYGLERLTAEPYRPLAVADLDGDDAAEIVFRESEGPAWNDTILAPAGTAWSRVAESIGGGTI